MSDAIPDKQYFKIGEVCRITGVKAHVLRYWESELSVLRPQKTRTNQRLYRRSDVELLLLVKRLLYQEGYTIAGANRKLRELAHAGKEPERAVMEALREARRRVAELVALVESD